MKLESVPVIVLEHLSETQQRAYRIADNQLALNSSWDEELLAEELRLLMEEAFALDLLGFTDDALKRLCASPELQIRLTDEDAVPAPARTAVSQRSDRWRLDSHRLLCGDATSREDLDQLMGSDRAAMVFTDPPYNVAYGKSKEGSRHRAIANDDLGAGFESFLEKACQNLLRVTGGGVYLCMSSSELHTLYSAFQTAGGHYSTFLIWAKNHFTLGRSDYQRQYEPILYGWRKGAERFWSGARNQGDVWFHPKPHVNDLHPTMKPVALVEQAIGNSSERGDVVLDPFGGSGTTLIACEKTGRAARLMELDPLYVDVIVRRWEEFTGRAAMLEGDGRTFAQVARERGTAGKSDR